jgi:RNA recognition motif-containing protein
MSKGFGFVRFGSKEEADQALQTMNGVYCSSRPMRVSVATERNSNRAPRMDFGGGGDPQLEAANTTVFIGGLDATTMEEELRARFSPFGEVCFCIPYDLKVGLVSSSYSMGSIRSRRSRSRRVGAVDLCISWQRKRPRWRSLR